MICRSLPSLLLVAALTLAGCPDFGRLDTFIPPPDSGPADAGGGTDTGICTPCGCTNPVPRDEAFDPGTVSFATSIEPIFNGTCAAVGPCHAMFAGGLDLTSGNAYTNIFGVPALSAPSFNYVTAGDPASSFLMAKLMGTHVELLGQCFGCSMPFSGECLDGETLQTFWRWIEQGAMNN